MLYLEVGNSTFKLARRRSDETFHVERFSEESHLLEKLDAFSDRILLAPVAGERAAHLVPLLSSFDLHVLDNGNFRAFIGDSYDTPDTLGMDRILNLFALEEDATVISCGTAITIDVLSQSLPGWGAILPGFTTARKGLVAGAPALPEVSVTDLDGLPARTSHGSVANGIYIGTAFAVRGIASYLAKSTGLHEKAPIVLTGGDARLLAELWGEEPYVTVVPDLLFQGMHRFRPG